MVDGKCFHVWTTEGGFGDRGVAGERNIDD